MLQVLAVEPGDRILEIGTGSGYVTALLARSGREVTTVEIHPELSAGAKVRVSQQGLDNVRFEVGNGLEHKGDGGASIDQGYDVIAVTGSLPVYTDHFEKRLAVCGRVFLIVGQAPVMEAMLVTRVGARELAREKPVRDRPATVAGRADAQEIRVLTVSPVAPGLGAER